MQREDLEMPKTWLKSTLVILALVGVVFLGCGNNPTKPAVPTWSTYNTSNSGLPNNSVPSIAIDGSGDKWFGTFGGGVSKFDGDTTWTTYNTSNSGLADNSVLAIAIDGSGNKWIGTLGGGVSKFHE